MLTCIARGEGARSRRAGRVGGRGKRSCRPTIGWLEGRVLTASDVVLEWNRVLLDAAAVDSAQKSPAQAGPTRTSRAMAIVHVAIYDAVNGIDGTYTPYTVRDPAPKGASIDAAAAQAARDTLIALYPQQRTKFDGALRNTLARVPDGDSETKGVEYGRRVARDILRLRQGDGSQLNPPYTPRPGPGRWRPDPLNSGQKALTPGWGEVKPFALKSGSQFRSAPPPRLTSEEYAAAFNEVKRLGGDGVTTPTSRTREQTRIGQFWAYDGPGLGTPPRLYNQAVRAVSFGRGNSLVQNARLFALVNIAMADAGISSWGTKYAFDFWRPITAIREADTDGNPATVAAPNWTPLGAPGNGVVRDFTPPFPAYSSGHAAFGAATFRTLANFYGSDTYTFTLRSDEFDGVRRPSLTRTYRSFSQAAEENGQSRIYLGIHFQFDNTAGQAEGSKIADYVFQNFLTSRGSNRNGGDTVVAAPRPANGPGLASSQAVAAPDSHPGVGMSILATGS